MAQRGRVAAVGAVGVLAALVMVVAAAIAILGGANPGPVPAKSASFTASRVTVNVRVVGTGDRRTVEAVFTPDAPDLHLYGPDLPRTGVDGAGRPTLVSVTGGGWQEADSAQPAVHPTPFPTELPGFWAAFSVLPAGPATLRLPIAAKAGANRAVAVVSVTYMACSTAGRCFAPVEAQSITIAVPDP